MLVASMRAGRGFEVDLTHVTIVGRCASCRELSGPGH
jgi:hypothetical protein